MDEQLGVRGFVRQLREEAPLWARTIPHLPRLVHRLLAEDPLRGVENALLRLEAQQRRQTRVLALIVAAALLFYPILGNLRPDKVSFLPSMRQYAGNWASALWTFAPGTEQKLDRVTRPTRNQVEQFVAFGYEPAWAEITSQKTIAWRSMHSQGRGLYSLLLAHLPDIDTRTVREGEFVCNSLIGFNFGDGHLHDADMIKAVQDEAGFEPGECVIAWVESEAFGSGVQHYQLIDAALGVIERGTWKVADAVAEQPWLPNGPIATEVSWWLKGTKPAASRKEQEHGHGALA